MNDVDNAEAVTTTGQTVIKNTANMGNIKYNKELGTKDVDSNIYIDTDSCYVQFQDLYESITWLDESKKLTIDEFVLAFYAYRLKDYIMKCMEKYAEKRNTDNFLVFELESFQCCFACNGFSIGTEFNLTQAAAEVSMLLCLQWV